MRIINIMSDTVQIDLNDFKEYYKGLNKQLIPNNLIKKKEEIQSTFNCFQVSFEYYYNPDKKHYAGQKPRDIQTTKYTRPNSNRLYIISSNFTEENKSRKQFISLLNKLTESNKISLYAKLLKPDNMKKELYDIIWEFIKKSPDNLYINLLYHYDMQLTIDKWNNYMDTKVWCPSDNIIQSNILTADATLYDAYCDYVKWKKEVTNMHKAWCIILNNYQCLERINELVYALYDMFECYRNKKIHKHIVDYALEQILIIMKYNKIEEIISKLKLLELKEYESSTKFVILNIIEL